MREVTFSQELQKPVIDLPRAGLLFARELAYPDLDVAAYLARLEELAAQARSSLPASGPSAAALASFLFEELAFRGNASAYDDPRNSFLNEVLERRLGIPITLSVVYLSVARRLQIDAYGIGLPGHFIVGVREGVDEILLDPFHEGVRLTLADCERLVRQTTGYTGSLKPAWLRPAVPRAILTRMLNNLRIVYVRREQWEQALAVIERLQQVQPESADHLRDLGLIHYQQGELYEAARYLEAYMEQAPETAEAAAIRQNLQPAFSRWAKLN